MRLPTWIRTHLAAVRALLVLTVITGLAYPLAVWAVAMLPGLHDKANGSIVESGGRPVASALIGQQFVDSDGKPLAQYFQGRPSAAGIGYDALASGASNLGPESVRDTPADPALLAQGRSPHDAGFRASLLSTVCAESLVVGRREGVDGSRPFCTPDGVGAVLSVIGPRDSEGNVVDPDRVVSINESCSVDPARPTTPFIREYEGVSVECAEFGADYSNGRLVPIRGDAPRHPAVPADAVTSSGSGLDPHISPQYADLQAARVAAARGIGVDQVDRLIADNRQGRTLGFIGEPRVNVVELNIELDAAYPVPR
ncbi:potassium-transporting ATPase subunit C [Rhodococcus sp. ABRD24]|uniref:potassium-transporting ATPase subunit C n=1 Tax=Rhodococcus sp. ABRD24 TaxID=2507582 RepID=UPI00103F3329|nr:potassium-transporting ATPase subunit C [Rhodococcus sp. ABRD24]QBJ98165.1 potassium-transporting ATPase subunit C [Rhodococcus sp. ABRD24]